MEYDELMKQLGESLGLENFQPDGDGAYSIQADDTVVTFESQPQSGLLDILALVCELPAEGGDRICRILLTAMAPAAAAEGFAFFIVDDDGCVYLRRTVALAELDVERLRQALEKFLNALDEWRSSIDDFSRVQPAVDAALAAQAAEDRAHSLNVDGYLKV